jgi:hypothetical protein
MQRNLARLARWSVLVTVLALVGGLVLQVAAFDAVNAVGGLRGLQQAQPPGPDAASTAQAALREAVQTLQATMTEEVIVAAGATDFGSTRQLFAFGQHELDLPGSFTFCWPGRASNGYGFETIVQSLGVYAAIDRIAIAYLDDQCR